MSCHIVVSGISQSHPLFDVAQSINHETESPTPNARPDPLLAQGMRGPYEPPALLVKELSCSKGRLSLLT